MACINVYICHVMYICILYASVNTYIYINTYCTYTGPPVGCQISASHVCFCWCFGDQTSYPWSFQVCVTMEKGSPVQTTEQNLLPRGTFLT